MVKQIPLQSVQQAGPEGSSLWCGKCGAHEYVIPKHEKEGVFAACTYCGMKHAWSPRAVLCAAPSHNGPGACNNPQCWKSEGGGNG